MRCHILTIQMCGGFSYTTKQFSNTSYVFYNSTQFRSRLLPVLLTHQLYRSEVPIIPLFELN